MNDASAIGSRRWIADAARWRHRPDERIEPTLELAAARDATSGAELPLRERIRRLADAREDVLRRRGQSAEAGEHAAPPSPPEPSAAGSHAASEAAHHPRQSARPSSAISKVPGLVRPSLPAEAATTYVQEIPSENEALADDVQDLRQEVVRLREEVAVLRKVAGAGMGPVERAVQRLAERVDRLDGGARPQVIDRRPRADAARGNWFFRLFAPRR